VKKIKLFGGKVVFFVDDIKESQQSFAVANNNPALNFGLAAARTRRIPVVTEEFINHSCYFKQLMPPELYVPFKEIRSMKYALNLNKRPIEGKHVLVLSEEVAPYLSIKYLMDRAGAICDFGYQFLNKMQRNELEYEYDWVLFYGPITQGVVTYIRQQNLIPVNEWFFIMVETIGMLFDPLVRFYTPEEFFEFLEEED